MKVLALALLVLLLPSALAADEYIDVAPPPDCPNPYMLPHRKGIHVLPGPNSDCMVGEVCDVQVNVGNDGAPQHSILRPLPRICPQNFYPTSIHSYTRPHNHPPSLAHPEPLFIAPHVRDKTATPLVRSSSGGQESKVKVLLQYNDWGLTFGAGWQNISVSP